MADQHPFFIAVHMGAGHHSRKQEHKYRECELALIAHFACGNPVSMTSNQLTQEKCCLQ